MCVKAVLVALTQILVMAAAEELIGRHVCTHQQVIADPVPVQQSYIRAVHRKDLQKTVYQTAYKTVFKMQIRYANVSGCCPGWEKRTPRDTNCMLPVCEEDCENGGQCVGPGLCVCGEGYTGYRCHMDIDECSGRNSCQQKCTNLPGSYQCSCQEGFQLGEDDYTCDLCLSCADEFKELSAQVERLQIDNNLDEVVGEIKQMMDNLTFEVTQTNALSDLQRELANLSEVVVQNERFEGLQKEVNTLKDSIVNVEIVNNLNSRLDVLEESSLHKDKFREIQTKLDDLASVEVVAEIAQNLNDTIKSLRDEVIQTKQIDDVQKQIEELAVVKAQQDEAQAGKLQEMHRELELLRDGTELSKSVQEVKELLEDVSGRIVDLESGQLDSHANSSFQSERLQDLRREVDVLKGAINDDQRVREVSVRLGSLEELSQRTFEGIKAKLDALATKDDVAEVAHSLNETIESLRQEGAGTQQDLKDMQTLITELQSNKEEQEEAQDQALRDMHTQITDLESAKTSQEDSRNRELKDMQKQIADLQSAKESQEETQADMFEELHKQLGQLQEIAILATAVEGMREQMDHLASRVQELEVEKAALKTSLEQVVSQHEAAAGAFHAKEVDIHHVTTDPYESESDGKISDDRLMSLSAQISILEEKMADCQCGQDYSRG